MTDIVHELRLSCDWCLDECDSCIALKQRAADEVERLKKIANGRLCASCLETHDIDVMCPPHEVRTTGQAWFREQLDTKSREIERLRAALADIASMCEQFPSGICYDADCDDTSPEDAAAHTAGLIWQLAKEVLGD